MNEERLEKMMREFGDGYNRPGEPPLDKMWERIEGSVTSRPSGPRWGHIRHWMAPVIGLAATLLLGIGIGRVSVGGGPGANGPDAQQTAAQAAALEQEGTMLDDDSSPYRAATSKYLGQAAILLVALPEAGETNGRPALVNQAGDLLSTTRILLDSPAAHDPSLRELLGDLELVLAQIVRLHARSGGQEMDMITDALHARDVIPRIHTAVTSAAGN